MLKGRALQNKASVLRWGKLKRPSGAQVIVCLHVSQKAAWLTVYDSLWIIDTKLAFESCFSQLPDLELWIQEGCSYSQFLILKMKVKTGSWTRTIKVFFHFLPLNICNHCFPDMECPVVFAGQWALSCGGPPPRPPNTHAVDAGAVPSSTRLGAELPLQPTLRLLLNQ